MILDFAELFRWSPDQVMQLPVSRRQRLYDRLSYRLREKAAKMKNMRG